MILAALRDGRHLGSRSGMGRWRPGPSPRTSPSYDVAVAEWRQSTSGWMAGGSPDWTAHARAPLATAKKPETKQAALYTDQARPRRGLGPQADPGARARRCPTTKLRRRPTACIGLGPRLSRAVAWPSSKARQTRAASRWGGPTWAGKRNPQGPRLHPGIGFRGAWIAVKPAGSGRRAGPTR